MNDQKITSDSKIIVFQRIDVVFSVILAIFLFIAVLLRSLHEMDLNWDVPSYHLPFIALRMGMMTPEQFVLPYGLQLYFDGFSPLLDYMRGVLWLASGHIEATNLLNLIFVSLLVCYLGMRWKLNICWTFIALMVVPAIQTAISSAYTDIVSNAALAIVVLSVVEAWNNRRVLQSLGYWAFLAVAAVTAGNSKLQISAITSLTLLALIPPLIGFCVRDAQHRVGEWLVLAMGLVIFAAANATLIANFIKFGNPVYPVPVHVGPINFDGPYLGGSEYLPDYLRPLPQAVRWLLSALEYRALELRPVTYTLGMGEVQEGLPSARMGGFFGAYAVFCIILIVYNTVTYPNRRNILSLISLICITIVVANLPASHESRYYLVWMMLAVIYAISTSSENATHLRFFKMVSVSSLIFVIAVTGVRYLEPTNAHVDKMVQFYDEFLVENIEKSDVFCAADNTRLAFLASPVMHPEFAKEHPYSIRFDDCGDRPPLPLPTW